MSARGPRSRLEHKAGWPNSGPPPAPLPHSSQQWDDHFELLSHTHATLAPKHLASPLAPRHAPVFCADSPHAASAGRLPTPPTGQALYEADWDARAGSEAEGGFCSMHTALLSPSQLPLRKNRRETPGTGATKAWPQEYFPAYVRSLHSSGSGFGPMGGSTGIKSA